jgi:hypothetical protein
MAAPVDGQILCTVSIGAVTVDTQDGVDTLTSVGWRSGSLTKTSYKIINGKIVDVTNRTGWYSWKETSFSIPNLNYGDAKTREEAETLVAAGTHRWKFGQGGVLALVRADSELLLWEDWLIEYAPGRFRVSRR